MNQRKTPWFLIAATLVLWILPFILPVLIFPYAETTKDPDAIEAPIWFLSVGLLFLAFLFIPITGGVWLFKSNQSNDN